MWLSDSPQAAECIVASTCCNDRKATEDSKDCLDCTGHIDSTADNLKTFCHMVPTSCLQGPILPIRDAKCRPGAQTFSKGHCCMASAADVRSDMTAMLESLSV